MFKAIIQDASSLRDSLDAISTLITEGSFKISKDGIELIAMDPASVALVMFKILPSAFLDFQCDSESTICLGLTNLVSILKRAKANDQITFELTDNKLKISMKGDFKRNFSIPLIDTPPGSQKIPELNFKGKIEVAASALRDGVRDASMVSDCVVLESSPLSFNINSFGDISETKMELTKDSPSLIVLESNGDLKSKYSIDYLEKMLKGAKVADNVTLQFSTDYPLRLDCTAMDKLQLSFILAPRVDTD